ncbi:MAG: FimB/Mfa2 family fimbrial subunit [Muribaculaceae bacterium]|nr:FimB/Mfa2 family fimbrial subunit [Muribaculaceae bacterium]
MKIFPILKRLNAKHFTLGVILSSITFGALTSCDMVNEDMPPCATYPNTYLTVNFVYDYNMLREDLFDSHAGTAHLYVFDKDSVFLFDRAVSRNDMTGPTVDFSMTFDTTYIKTGMKYLLVAMAQGNHSGYEWSTIATPGFQIPLQYQMVPGVSKISDYRIMLDRDSDSWADIGVVDYTDAYGNNKEMLDTLWSTKPNEIQDVAIPYIELKPQVEEYPVYYYEVLMPMMRITNSITVNLLHDSFTPETDVNRFNILIDFPKGNGTIGFTGQTFPNRELFYRALRKGVVKYTKKNNGATYEDPGVDRLGQQTMGTRADDPDYAIQATFGISRLQTVDESKLQVRDAETNEVLIEIDNFAQWLADYFNTYYDDQEFLDREYNFTVDIKMSDANTLEWYQIGCSILGWGKRVYEYIPR